MSPFSQEALQNLAAEGEISLLKKIRGWLGSTTPPPPRGMGDDCAVLSNQYPAQTGQQILTVDALTYGQHFDDSITPQAAGAKLMKRNISDIAAMGGRPEAALLALLCGPDVSLAWLKAFFQGLRETCLHYRIEIVGGDVSALGPGQFSSVLTLTGHAQNPRLRTSAQAGDWLYVTGTLGGSIRHKHFSFTPRLQEGQWLAAQTACNSMMDLTDGLAKDVPALLPKGTAAELDLTAIPVSTEAQLCAYETGASVLQHAFCDGEDYELLFTLRATVDTEAFEKAWSQKFPELRLSCIGKITACEQDSPRLIDAATKEALPWRAGFEHFKPA